MINDYLSKPYEIGTVLKESTSNGCWYYLVGPYYIYSNDPNDPYIRPYKFSLDNISEASEEERQNFFKELKQNHYIVTDNYELERESLDYTITISTKLSKDIMIRRLKEIGEIINIKYN